MAPGPVFDAEPGMGPGPALGAGAVLAALAVPGTGAAADSVAAGVA